MIPVEPGSQSIILRATHILEIRLDAAKPGEWSHHPSGWLERRVDIEVTLIHVFKGTLQEAVNDSLRLTVIQLDNLSPWKTAILGVWSEKDLEAGSRLVAFCIGHSESVAELLKEPFCQQLRTVSDASDDVALALQAETERPGLEQVIDRAIQTAPTLNDLFMEYLWARWQKAALQNPQDFNQVMEIFETPSLGYTARATLLNLVIGDVLSGRASVMVTNRFVVALFRLLGIKEAAPLHDNIISTYLPNLLGLGTSNEHAARDVFREFPSDRERAEQTLSGYKGNTSATYLQDWLRRSLP